MKIFSKKGQNMAEYSILIALIVAAAIGMKVYVQRGMQARIHDESDALINKISNDAVVKTSWTEISKANVTAVKQYEPDYLTKEATTETVKDEEKYTLEKGGTTKQEITKTTKQSDEDYEQYGYTKE